MINEGAIKIIEVVGVSEKGFHDAITQAVQKASKTIKDISGLEVLKHTATVENGKITQYRVTVKLAFPVEN